MGQRKGKGGTGRRNAKRLQPPDTSKEKQNKKKNRPGDTHRYRTVAVHAKSCARHAAGAWSLDPHPACHRPLPGAHCRRSGQRSRPPIHPPTPPAATSHGPNPWPSHGSTSSRRGATGRALPNRGCPTQSRPAPRRARPPHAAPLQEMLVVSSGGHRSVRTVQAGGCPRACQCTAGAGKHGPSSAPSAPWARGSRSGRGQRAGRRAPTHAPARVAMTPRRSGSVGHGCREPSGCCKGPLPRGATVGWVGFSSAGHLELNSSWTALGTLV